MKHLLIFIILISTCCSVAGQNNDPWFAFENKKTKLIGYKDKNGIVKLKPIFHSFSSATKFDNIIAVNEVTKKKWVKYYLTKARKIVGKDSVYTSDFVSDCENEGFIRFRDNKNDKVGMFNKEGTIVIPPNYNELSKVRNGLVVALQGSEKKYWAGGEHYDWEGGVFKLIDTQNNVLIDTFSLDNDLDYYSLEKLPLPTSDTTKKSFLGRDGSYYTFVDVEKHFKQWLISDLLDELTPQKLINASLKSIAWTTSKKYGNTNHVKFITNNFSVVKNGLLEVLKPSTDYFISKNGLNRFGYRGKEFENYFDNCGEAKEWIYPTMTIVITHHQNKKDFTQNSYGFLKTDEGYKLISVVVHDATIRL